MAVSTALYCTQDDMEQVLSVSGVELRLDDYPSDTNFVIDDASALIDAYLLTRYDPAQLGQSRWVRHACTDIAIYNLCMRRANSVPGSILKKYEDTIKMLEKAAVGALKLGDISPKRPAIPFMSNMRPSVNPWPRTVVQKEKSTGTATIADYRQKTDPIGFTTYVEDYVI